MTLEKKEKIKRIFKRCIHIFCYVCTGLFFLLLIIGFANGGSKSTKKSEEYHPRNVVSEPVKHNLIVDNSDGNLYLQNVYDFINVIESCPFDPTNPVPLHPLFEGSYDDGNEDTYIYFVGHGEEAPYFTFQLDNGSDVIDFDLIYENGRFSFDTHAQWYIDSTINDLYSYFEVFNLYLLSTSDVINGVSYYNTYMIGYDADTLFGGLTESLTDFVGTLNEGTDDVITLFYDDGLTTLGIFATISVAVVLAWVGFRIISGLFRLRG